MTYPFLSCGWVEFGSSRRRRGAGFLLQALEHAGRGRARTLAEARGFELFGDTGRIGLRIEGLVGALGRGILGLPLAQAAQGRLRLGKRGRAAGADEPMTGL